MDVFFVPHCFYTSKNGQADLYVPFAELDALLVAVVIAVISLLAQQHSGGGLRRPFFVARRHFYLFPIGV